MGHILVGGVATANHASGCCQLTQRKLHVVGNGVVARVRHIDTYEQRVYQGRRIIFDAIGNLDRKLDRLARDVIILAFVI